jgi:hypothetical protein
VDQATTLWRNPRPRTSTPGAECPTKLLLSQGVVSLRLFAPPTRRSNMSRECFYPNYHNFTNLRSHPVPEEAEERLGGVCPVPSAQCPFRRRAKQVYHVMLSFSSRSWSGNTVPASLSEHRKKDKIPTKSNRACSLSTTDKYDWYVAISINVWLHGSPSGGRGTAFRFSFRFSRFSRIDAVSVTH